MEFRKIRNKEGEILTTKEGKELEKLYFEEGDEFVPCYNRVYEKVNKDVEVINQRTGKKRKQDITNYLLKCRVRNKDKVLVVQDDSNEVFVTLTPTQAISLKKKIDSGLEIHQHLFVAYKYSSENFGEQIGVGLKKAQKPAKTFEDFDNETVESIKEE